ncbi:MAG: aminopeptidase [Ignavibacteriae bacterium]|nr:leucyl aminopeptidase [Ignavibacteriota bacterium]NOH00240.1 aminopeptidase [Ignavibacteriota bacterium]
MKNLLMAKGAKTLVDICTKVKSQENVLIVTDFDKLTIAESIAAASIDRGAETMISIMQPRDRAGQEPPSPIAAAMTKADVIFIPVSFSITHTNAVKNAAASNARIIVMTDFTEEMMIRGGITADFEQLKPTCKAVADSFTKGSKLKLTSPGGTDLEMKINGRKGNALYCIVEPGEFSTVPTVEANVSPLENTANGTIVCDASIPYLGIGIIESPIKFNVENGFITGIEGGRQAEILRDNLESFHDNNVFNIAEVGVGLNPNCIMCGIMLEDEGVISTCHIGIGTSITLGGNVKTAIHYDLIMWQPKILIDNTLVLNGPKVFV